MAPQKALRLAETRRGVPVVARPTAVIRQQ
jgi:hypothetical protein